MNNRGHLVALPDIWVGRDTERALVAAARADGLTVRQVVTLLVEREWGDTL